MGRRGDGQLGAVEQNAGRFVHGRTGIMRSLHLSVLACALALLGCGPDKGPRPQSRDTGTAEPIASSPGPHDHVASCWLDGDTAYRDNAVDMLLVVVGLNHRSGVCERCAVGGDGVSRLAQAIYEAWPHPENIVIVGSALGGACACTTTDPPVPAQRLADELHARYEEAFTVSVADSPDPRWPGSIGVIAGKRWKSIVVERLQFIDWLAMVRLNDTVTGLTVPIFAMHAGQNFLISNAIADIKDALSRGNGDVKKAAQRGKPIYTVPIIAGDFNFTEDSVVSEGLGAFLSDNLTWENKDIQCVEAGGLPSDLAFPTQNGNLMNAFAGRIDAVDPAMQSECAVADFGRVRFSYSVDSSGRLAFRAGDGRSAEQEGVLLEDIAHNVIILGLSIHRREGDLPDDCAPQHTCSPSAPWCECSGRCDTDSKCRACEGGEGPCPQDKPPCRCNGDCLLPNQCDDVCP
jgi:hypothetical protein